MSIDARLIKRLPAAAASPAFELNIHLQATPGITVLLGPSGSGKTLTLNCIAGFARPDEGRILVNDELYFDAAAHVQLQPRLRRCGYVFQDHALFPHMTVRENLRFAAASARSKGRSLTQHRRINEMLEAFELADLAARKPAQLSGGQKQRAALARTLITEPRMILLDEPTRGLDARLRQSFYEILRQTRERLQIPMLLVTHDLDECFELADYVCLMDRGRFLQTGERDQVLNQPANADAARFLGVYSVVTAEIAALDPGRNTSKIAVFEQEIEGRYLPGRLLGDRGLLCIRESEIKVSAPAARSSGSLLLAVSSAVPLPDGVRIQFAGGISATVAESEYQRLRGCERLQLQIPASAVSFVAG
ncbi:MAG: ATP-binding cassette domain-containing protein [Acidobacteriota bacterium]|nr:ATP-binding cassette domain-containing protein [Acidobacteriota bacterium]